MFDIKGNTNSILQTPPVIKSDAPIYFREFLENINIKNYNKNSENIYNNARANDFIKIDINTAANDFIKMDINILDNCAIIYKNRNILNENIKDVLFILTLEEFNNQNEKLNNNFEENKQLKNLYKTDDFDWEDSFKNELYHRLSLPHFGLKQC